MVPNGFAPLLVAVLGIAPPAPTPPRSSPKPTASPPAPGTGGRLLIYRDGG